MVIKWSLLAVNTLKDIYNFYLPQAGAVKSKQIVEEIRQVVRFLLIFPEMGTKAFIDGKDLGYRYVIKNNCKIYYTIHERYIRIAFVWDTRRNPEDIRNLIEK